MNRRRILVGTFLFVTVLGLGWQLGVQVTRKQYEDRARDIEQRFGLAGSGVTVQGDPEEDVDLTLFWTVWRLLDQHYVDPAALKIDELRYGAVRGLVNAIGDPYSGFMTPVESTDFQQVLRGELEGIGAELTMQEDAVVIVAPLKGSPAARAGLLPRDIITAVDDQTLENMNLQEVVRRIRGPKGTEVRIKIFRPGTSEELEFTITREAIHVPSVEYEVLETGSGSVGYLTLNQFGDDTVAETRKALLEFKGQSLSGVVLDLRFNGGGYLDGSIEVVSLFLDKGKVVSVEKRGEEVESHYVLGDPVLPDIPLVVLINEGSASASEIVAGALQDHERAKIVGIKSFGKGTVQDVIDLPGGSSLRITIAKWKTPNGRDLSKEGVMPDVEVQMEAAAYLTENDIQKERAMEVLLDGVME